MKTNNTTSGHPNVHPLNHYRNQRSFDFGGNRDGGRGGGHYFVYNPFFQNESLSSQGISQFDNCLDENSSDKTWKWDTNQ